MFKWLFQGKKIALEKANAKRLEQEETNRQDVAGVKERVEYLFSHRTNEKGQPFTFADLEAATASQNPARQVSVNWLNDLTQGQLVGLQGDLGRLFATSDFFDAPSGFNFWFGDFTEELKTQIRVTNYFITGQWQKVYDTESVLFQPTYQHTNFDEPDVELFRQALANFVNSSDFKPTLAENLLLSLEDSYLILRLASDKTYKVLPETDLMHEPFLFEREKMNELKYLLEEGWDFEWKSLGVECNQTINLSVSVPDGIVIEQVKKGGPAFVQQLLEDQVNLGLLTEHLRKRLNYFLGSRTPDLLTKSHRRGELIQFCGIESGVVTVGDLRRLNGIKADGQYLSPLDETKANVIKSFRAYLQDNDNLENQRK